MLKMKIPSTQPDENLVWFKIVSSIHVQSNVMNLKIVKIKAGQSNLLYQLPKLLGTLLENSNLVAENWMSF